MATPYWTGRARRAGLYCSSAATAGPHLRAAAERRRQDRWRDLRARLGESAPRGPRDHGCRGRRHGAGRPLREADAGRDARSADPQDGSRLQDCALAPGLRFRHRTEKSPYSSDRHMVRCHHTPADRGHRLRPNAARGRRPRKGPELRPPQPGPRPPRQAGRERSVHTGPGGLCGGRAACRWPWAGGGEVPFVSFGKNRVRRGFGAPRRCGPLGSRPP